MTSDQEISRLLERATERHRAKDLDSAEKDYRKILKQHPNDPDALHLLGLIADERGDAQGAATLIRLALEVQDDFPLAHFHLALNARRAGDLVTAEHHLRRAVHYSPTDASFLCHLGTVLSLRGAIQESMEVLRAAIRHNPSHIDSYVQMARTLRTVNDIPGMVSAIEAGLAVAPQHPTLWLIASEAAFASGNLKAGWNAYRWRFQSPENRVPGKTYSLPLWQGESLTGKSILVWAEQAPGDEIMYAGMIPDIAASAKRCAVQCSPRLTALMRRSFPNVEVFDRDLTVEELKVIDVQTPAAGPGEWLRSDLSSFPKHTGYLRADPTLRAQLRAKYEAAGRGRCIVGIAWRSAGVENAADKSVGVLDWGPILNVPGVTFVNLQYGDCRAELAAAAKGFGATIVQDDAIDPLKDLDAYAAQVAAMDVVISSSNTAAHFAGGLGVPVFCMLPISLGRGRRWYWFADKGACPWYPSMQMFLQRYDGQWMDVIRDAGVALLDFAAARGVIAKPAIYLRSAGKAFADAGRLDDAEYIYRRLAKEPGLAGEGFCLAATLKKIPEQIDAALSLYDEAIAQDPAFFQAYNGRGQLLVQRGHIYEAIECYREGLKHNPKSGELHNNLGSALHRLGRSAESLSHFRQADKLRPGTASIHVNLAATLDETGDIDAALLAIDEAIRLKPAQVDAHYNKAQILLSHGRFAEGWAEFSWRLKRAGTAVHYGLFPYAVWNGEDLAGKSILIWTEQGIGDEILTASIIPDALAAASHVTILCSGRMVPLMQRSFPSATVDNLNVVIRRAALNATEEERNAPLPPAIAGKTFDYQMSLSELGLAFRRTFKDFPVRTKFLASDASLRDALRAKYQARKPGTRLVGISWRSRRGDELDRLKSQDLSAWAPILATPDVHFVNLQYGDCADELARVRENLGVDILHDPEIDPLRNMDAFAAQVAAMDLVISVSNTTVHTAGAQGVPIWVLLAEGRGRIWYWFRDRFDSPWYPSARLIRQETSGDWRPTIDRCAIDLTTWAKPSA